MTPTDRQRCNHFILDGDVSTWCQRDFHEETPDDPHEHISAWDAQGTRTVTRWTFWEPPTTRQETRSEKEREDQ